MQLWGMLETLTSFPLWLYLCFALLFLALAWWQAPRICPQLVGYEHLNTKASSSKGQAQSNLSYWGQRLFYLFLFMFSLLALESIIWQQSTFVNSQDAEGKKITQAIPMNYAVKHRLWQLGIKPLPTLVSIPAGKFMMGSDTSRTEQPIHDVSIPQAFHMSQHEVTFEQYDYFIWRMHEAGLKHRSTSESVDYEYPNDEGWGRDNRPVINVSWDDAQYYVNWVSKETGQQCRLPSEAEWEYAARAGTQSKYFWGDDIGTDNANCDRCGSKWDGKQTAPIGSFPANQFGLYDMHGNVFEWVQDIYQSSYEGAPSKGEAWIKGDGRRGVLRGGSWLGTPNDLRSASRYNYSPVLRSNLIGFRIVCSPPSAR